MRCIQEGYNIIQGAPSTTRAPQIGVQDNIIWTKNPYLRDVVCIPHEVFIKGRRLIEIIIDHAHQVVGHFNHMKTSNYIRRSYWWPRMATDIESFCNSCAKCHVNKTSTQKPVRELGCVCVCYFVSLH